MAELPRLSDQDIPDQSNTVEVAAAPDIEGASLLERLMGPAEAEPDQRSLAVSEEPNDPALTDTPQKKTGLLAMLTRAAPPRQDVVSTPEKQAVNAALLPETVAQPEMAALPAHPEEKPDFAAGTKHKSIFGINTATSAKPTGAVSEVAPGTLLPYGKVARICGLPKRELGKQVAQYPDKRPKHRVYDSAAGSTVPRTFFVTGFDDGCARQFTASLAMFGSASMHEQLRYGLPSQVQPYSDTDKAYEKLKSRVCSVPRKTPCGAKVSRMEKDTVFLSIYERFGSNPHWTNLLLHDGAVLAQDAKGG